jgi:Na+-translocating ferredoxin:NAD+ oxidoreductase RNF subunit RnfB
VAVGPLDRGEQCGSNGGCWDVVVAVLAEIWSFENVVKKIKKIKSGSGCGDCGCDGGRVSGSGWVAVGPLDRGDQCGSNGGGWDVVVAVLAEIWSFGNVAVKKKWQWLGGSFEIYLFSI